MELIGQNMHEEVADELRYGQSHDLHGVIR